jgi:hypothetical protein
MAAGTEADFFGSKRRTGSPLLGGFWGTGACRPAKSAIASVKRPLRTPRNDEVAPIPAVHRALVEGVKSALKRHSPRTAGSPSLSGELLHPFARPGTHRLEAVIYCLTFHATVRLSQRCRPAIRLAGATANHRNFIRAYWRVSGTEILWHDQMPRPLN